MAIQGLIGTGDFVADERPLNWRQGVLMRFPNGHAPLVGLTSAMKKKVTDDPQYHHWERELSETRIALNEDMDNAETTLTVVGASGDQGGGLQAKPGDVLYVEESGELMLVTAVNSDTEIEVERDFTTAIPAPTAVAAVTGNGVNPNMLIVGSAYAEGQDTPDSVRYRPTKITNYTQIFRNSLKATRTAMKTRLRTVDEVQDAKRQALLYHTISMEWAFFLGSASERVDPVSGEMQRTTGGILYQLNSLAPANIIDQAGVAMDLETLEGHLLEMFRFGANEKLAFCGNRALLTFQQIFRKNSSYEISPATKEFGMNIRRVFTPFGTLVMKNHPLFNQIRGGVQGAAAYRSLDSWMVILDMANLSYRPLTDSDTKYLPDRQGKGIDGLTSEYLTEAGMEVDHGKTHFILKGVTSATADS